MRCPFDVLNLLPSLDLDGLDAHYRNLQKRVHPDLYQDIWEKQEASHIASDINQAYLLLKDPYTRSKALLERLNISTSTPVDPDFLMNVLEGDVSPQVLWDQFYKSWKSNDYHALPELFTQWSFARKRSK